MHVGIKCTPIDHCGSYRTFSLRAWGGSPCPILFTSHYGNAPVVGLNTQVNASFKCRFYCLGMVRSPDLEMTTIEKNWLLTGPRGENMRYHGGHMEKPQSGPGGRGRRGT